MVKSYTAYIINVNDFGRTYTIERRFDDFQKLHAEVSEIDKNLPSLPEKKMFASTDASVVAERRPAFEKLLRYMLRSEELACDTAGTKQQHVWKFLELSLPAMVAARYLFRSQRIAYLKQCGKLLDDKYIKEHAYRLCHDSILKTNLHLLSSEGQIVGSADASSSSKVNDPDMELIVVDMVRHAVAQGGEEARKSFLEEQGLGLMMKLLIRIAERQGASDTPDQRVRNVLNALIHGEGDRYSEVLASFLASGGVSILAGFQDLCKRHSAFAEFIGKALWLAWDLRTQQSFLEGDASGTEALGLLGAVFSCGTKVSQILAGLLLSSLIANDLFSNSPEREAKAAAGVSGMVEELLVSMPTFFDPRKAGDDKDAAGGEDLQAAEAFIVALGRNEKAFGRIQKCISAPVCRDDGCVAHVDSAVWSACSFALWCLLKTRPKPARVASIRSSIPLIAQYGPPRSRWLTGELLLHLHVEENAHPTPEGTSISGDAASQERNAVEAAMSEQIDHAVQTLEEGLAQNRAVMSQQLQLSGARQQALAIGSDGSAFSHVNKAIATLISVREKLAKASGSVESAETQSASALEGLTKALSTDSAASSSDLDRALGGVQEIEGHYLGRKENLMQLEEQLRDQGAFVETCRKEMEEADGAVSATRKRITEMEQELSSKQREAQQQRTLATSDVSARRSHLTTEMEEVEQKLEKLREKAQKLQNSEPLEAGEAPPEPAKVQEIMGQLKQQATQLKQRRAEIQAELSKSNVDPAAAQDAALKLEQEANTLHEQLNHVRASELQELEQSHIARREAWQRETSRLQEIRSMRDSSDRECTELKRQLDERWKVWRPLWSARLTHWHERASALSEAQLRNHRFVETVNSTWDKFREEESVREEVAQAVATAQDSLAEISRQLAEIGALQ
jgi:hypothetical protein